MAVAIDIQSKFNLDVDDAKNKVQSLVSSMQNANFTPITNAVKPPYSINGGNQSVTDLGGETSPVSSASDNIVEESKKTVDVLNSILGELQRTGQRTETAIADRDFNRKQLSYVGVNNAIGQTATTAKEIINGDFFSVAQTSTGNLGRNLQRGAQSLAALNDEDDDSGVAGALGKAGVIGMIVSAVIGIAKVGFDKLKDSYHNNLPSMEKFYSSYNNVGGVSRAENSKWANTEFQTFAKYADYTGYTNAEFFDKASGYAKYGVYNPYIAAKSTQSAANLSAITGVDFEQIQRLQGLNYRYAGVGGDTTVDQIYQKAAKSGFTIDELHKFMPEFLSNIEMAMETGVNSGFTKSVGEVADTLSFITRMSSNEAWRKNSGQTYQSMAQGMAGAVNLASSTDLIAYQAMGSGDYIQKAMELEEGPSPEKLQEIHNQMKAVYGNDKMSIVLAYKDLFGLNTTGSNILYEGLENGNVDLKEVQAMYSSKTDYKSDFTTLQNGLNAIDKNLTKLYSDLFEKELWDVNFKANLSSIIALLDKKDYSKNVGKSIEGLFTKGDSDDNTAKRSLEKVLETKLSDPTDAESFGEAKEFLEYVNSLSAEEKMYFNFMDFANADYDTIISNYKNWEKHKVAIPTDAAKKDYEIDFDLIRTHVPKEYQDEYFKGLLAYAKLDAVHPGTLNDGGVTNQLVTDIGEGGLIRNYLNSLPTQSDNAIKVGAETFADVLMSRAAIIAGKLMKTNPHIITED